MSDQHKTRLALQLVEMLAEHDLTLDELERALRMPHRYATETTRSMKAASIDIEYIDTLMTEEAICSIRHHYLAIKEPAMIFPYKGIDFWTQHFLKVEAEIDLSAILLDSLESMDGKDIEALALYFSHLVKSRRTSPPGKFCDVTRAITKSVHDVLLRHEEEQGAVRNAEESAFVIEHDDIQAEIIATPTAVRAAEVAIADIPNEQLNDLCKSGLRAEGITNLQQVAEHTEQQLLRVRLVGAVSISQLRKLLKKHGLALKGEAIQEL